MRSAPAELPVQQCSAPTRYCVLHAGTRCGAKFIHIYQALVAYMPQAKHLSKWNRGGPICSMHIEHGLTVVLEQHALRLVCPIHAYY